MSGEIIVRGRPIRCLAPVKNWTTTGMHFLARFRTQPTRYVINHWTGSENSAADVFRNMSDRGVSVHFIVDQLGEVYQCADTDARLAHCAENGGNTYGVGIEIINRGHGKAPAKGFERVRRTESIHGVKTTYGEFFPAQIAAVIALNEALCSIYSLPLVLPLKDGDVWPGKLPAMVLSRHRGPAGHLHFDDDKPDPGLDLLRRIHRHGLGLGNV